MLAGVLGIRKKTAEAADALGEALTLFEAKGNTVAVAQGPGVAARECGPTAQLPPTASNRALRRSDASSTVTVCGSSACSGRSRSSATRARFRSRGSGSGRCSRSCCSTRARRPDRPPDRPALGRAAAGDGDDLAPQRGLQLRRLLGSDALETRSPGYVLHVEREPIDAVRFERMLREARAADAEAKARMIREALGLWRGPALAEFTFDAWAQPQANRLEELRLVALEQRIDADLELGRHGDVVGEVEALVREHPLREPFRRQLMLALYRSGGRPRRSTPTRRRGRASSTSWGSSPGRS